MPVSENYYRTSFEEVKTLDFESEAKAKSFMSHIEEYGNRGAVENWMKGEEDEVCDGHHREGSRVTVPSYADVEGLGEMKFHDEVRIYLKRNIPEEDGYQ